MKKTLLLTFCLLLCLNFLGCESKRDESSQKAIPQNIIATNLSTDDDLKFMDSLFSKAKITADKQKQFWMHVFQFNDIMKKEELTDGFETLDFNNPKYDPYALADAWYLENPVFLGYNCRITAFSLFKDFIEAGDVKIEAEPDVLIMDLDTLAEDDSALSDKTDLEKFKLIYTEIPTQASSDINTHIKNVKDAWTERGISFIPNSKASLISMFFYYDIEPEKPKLFVGHTGILFNADDGNLYFLEKIAFQEPYQLIQFKDRSELNAYLMSKLHIDKRENIPAPFIMENDKLMENYTVLSE